MIYFMADCTFRITFQSEDKFVTRFFFSKVKDRDYVRQALIKKGLLKEGQTHHLYTPHSNHPNPISSLWTLAVAPAPQSPAP